ncbi:uncharacterized protein M6B38_253660 [Iris pallida]|uniref:Uncharacterized protein n=1 Tax=Iris pallida TaxID=29817 RepID=A0AAX6IHV3_IRIPA|nr:uncharacterized protein M6B38_253660 [Iris pallida]
MPTHRRRGPAAGADEFSFASPAREAAAGAYDRWAERIRGKYNYFGRLEDVKYGSPAGAWARGATASRCEDEPSPELWQAAGRRMVRSAEGSPVRRQEAESPAAIARYRQEMLDLVKDVPENAYELSLIDMVDTAKTTKAVKVAEEEEEEEEKNSKKMKKKKGTRSMSRSASMETGGLLLKMFVPRVPAALGGRRQSFSNSGMRTKVSPTRARRDVGEKGRGEGEWWSKEYGGMVSSTGSINSNGSSSSSNSSGSSIKSRIIGSCYPFVSHKSKQMGFEE